MWTWTSSACQRTERASKQPNTVLEAGGAFGIGLPRPVLAYSSNGAHPSGAWCFFSVVAMRLGTLSTKKTGCLVCRRFLDGIEMCSTADAFFFCGIEKLGCKISKKNEKLLLPSQPPRLVCCCRDGCGGLRCAHGLWFSCSRKVFEIEFL